MIDPAETESRAGSTGARGASVDGLMAEAMIDEEMMQRMRELEGVELRIDHSVNHEDVTRLAVAKFAAGVGDTNPLWINEESASQGPYGAFTAPPSFIIAAFSGIQFGWPGLGAFHCQSTIDHYAPVYVGDHLTARCRYEGFTGPQPSRFAGQMVVDQFRNTYTNQRGEVVAEIRWDVMNFERFTARKVGRETGVVLPHPWQQDELECIEAKVLAESPRGAVPRFWEDTNSGDYLEELIKGPLGLTDEVAFIAGGGAPIPRLAAHRAALRTYQGHPAWAFRDPTTSALEPIYAVHYNRQAAQAMGVPLQYDVGFQRQCWHTHLLTDWMGDDAWIKRSGAQYRRFVYHGDVVTLGGEVVEKRLDEDGEHVVDLRTWALNQRGEDVMPGTATIALPHRESDETPALRRARR
jgi:acyl dehydratase